MLKRTRWKRKKTKNNKAKKKKKKAKKKGVNKKKKKIRHFAPSTNAEQTVEQVLLIINSRMEHNGQAVAPNPDIPCMVKL
ncbi:hypothetical protein M8J76_005063 [Diaphorina citri]|nr:hypothetical protein M8J75_002829 [Diaphorina citri]KAI5732864.1 hypothetical protein M8J76_005063 [Diaphorina citri]